MSINPEDLQDDDPRGLREAVERSNREAAEAKAELDALKRAEAFRIAGLDFTNPQHAAIAKGYDGDAGGIQDFVSGLGLNQPPPAASTEEQQAMERMSSIGTGDGGNLEAPEASGNRRLKELTDKAVREGWPRTRFEDEFSAELRAQGRPVAQLEIQGPPH